jgi:hypothetical protein
VIEKMAAEHDREIDPEHFGVLIPYVMASPPNEILQGLKARRPDLEDVSRLLPTGWSELTTAVERFIDVGFSKFVVVPLSEPGSPEAWEEHLQEAASRLLSLQT